MGCGAGKSVAASEQLKPIPVEPVTVAVHQEFGQVGEDEVAVVETSPKRQKTPEGKVDELTVERVRESEKQLFKQKTSAVPFELSLNVSEPDQPKVKTSLNFENVGAAQINLDDLVDAPQEFFHVVKTNSNARRKKELDDLIADLDASMDL